MAAGLWRPGGGTVLPDYLAVYLHGGRNIFFMHAAYCYLKGHQPLPRFSVGEMYHTQRRASNPYLRLFSPLPLFRQHAPMGGFGSERINGVGGQGNRLISGQGGDR